MAGNGRTRWGWHRLDSRWARRFVAGAGVDRGDLVLDIGAGLGALTAPLVTAGARVIAVELNPQRAEVLRRRFTGKRVTVVVADAADLRLPRQPFKVVANPPFSVTTAVIKRLLAAGSRLVSAEMVVPCHAAHRWTSGCPPGVGRWGRTFHISIVGMLPQDAFVPPAPSAVAILRIRRSSVMPPLP